MRKVELLPTQDCEAGYDPVPDMRVDSSSQSSLSDISLSLHECWRIHRRIFC